MGQARDKQGNLWETDANGDGVRMIAPAPSAPAQGGIFSLPPDPAKQASEARAAADEQRRAAEWNASHNPDGTPKVQAPSLLGDPTKTGQAYLATLPQNIRGRVQQLLDGRSMLTAREKGQPLGQQLMDAANQADPNFDENVSHARYVERTQYTGQGKGSQTVQAAERIAQHVNDLYAASKALGGPDLGWSPLSNVATATTNSFRQAKVASYNQILPLISGELQKLTKNGTATVDESNKIEHNLRADQPEDVRYAAMKELVRLGRAQYDPLRDSWAAAWQGSTPPPMPMDFSPATTAIFDNIENGGEPLPMKRDKNGALIVPAGGYGGNAGGGSSGDAGGFATGPTRDVYSRTPMDKKIAGMLASHVPDAQIRQFVADNNAHYPGLDDTLRFRANNPTFKGAYDVSTKSVVPVTPTQRALDAGAQSGTGALIGHAVDKAAGGLPTLLAGEQGKRFNDITSAEHPYLSGAGDVGGTIAGMIGAGKVLGRAAPYLGRAGNYIRAADIVGDTPEVLQTANATAKLRTGLAGSYAYSGAAGAVNDPEHPFVGAAEGLAANAAGHGLGKYAVAPVIRAIGDTATGQAVANAALKVGGNVANAGRALVGKSPTSLTPFAPAAALEAGPNAILGATKNTVPPEIVNKLTDAAGLNLPYSLADADSRLQALAGSAARKNPDVGALAKNTLGGRMRAQEDRAQSLIANHLAKPGDLAAIQEDATSRAQAASKPLYEKAMSAPTPDDPHINEMLDRPAGSAAVRKAYDIALNEGANPGELSFGTAPDGTPIINGRPNWKTLQYVKMGFDSVVEDARDPITGQLNLKNPTVRALNKLRGGFVTRLGEINPDYAAANKAYGDIADQGSAAAMGAKAPASAVSPSTVQTAVNGVNPKSLPYYQQGYASNLSDVVNKTRLVSDPFKLIAGSPAQAQKLGIVFPKGADAFGRATALEGDMADTAHNVTGNSLTAARGEADKQFDSGIPGAAAELGLSAMTGVPPLHLGMQAARSGARGLLGGLSGRMSSDKAAKVGPILLNTDPQAALEALQQWVKQQALRQAYINNTRSAGSAIGTGLAVPTVLGASSGQ